MAVWSILVTQHQRAYRAECILREDIAEVGCQVGPHTGNVWGGYDWGAGLSAISGYSGWELRYGCSGQGERVGE